MIITELTKMISMTMMMIMIDVYDNDGDDLHNCVSIYSSSSIDPTPLEGVAGIRTPSKRTHFACTICLNDGIQLDFSKKSSWRTR